MRNLTTTLLVGFLLLGFNSSYAQLTDQEIINMNGFKGAKLGMTEEQVKNLPTYSNLFGCPVTVEYSYDYEKLTGIKILAMDTNLKNYSDLFFSSLTDQFGTKDLKYFPDENHQEMRRSVKHINVYIIYHSRSKKSLGFSSIYIGSNINISRVFREAREKKINDKNELLGN